MAQSKFLKISSNQCKSSKYWWDIWILGRGSKKTAVRSEQCSSFKKHDCETRGHESFFQSVCFLWEIKAVSCSLSLLTQTYKACWLFWVSKWLNLLQKTQWGVNNVHLSKSMIVKLAVMNLFFNLFVFCEKSKPSLALCHYLLKRTKLVGCLVCQSDKKTKRAVRTIVSSIPR